MINNLLRRFGAADAAVAAAAFACSLPGTLITLPGQAPEVPWWPGALLAGLSCIALMWRRTRPRITVAVTIACATVMAAVGYVLTVMLLGPLMAALHSLAVRTDRKTANAFTFTGIAVLLPTALIAGPAHEPLILKLIGPAAWLLLPTSLGTASRLRAAHLEAVQARAEHAERSREQEARNRVTEERLRIARDLHDVVAHHLVLANMQAAAVVRALASRPEEAKKIAAELTGTTASAMRELKATVGLLRHASDPDEPPPPTAGLAQLPDLAASFRHAGLTVTLTSEGEPRPLPAGTDLTAYRIVQEALTNVTKHAPTGTAEVRLTYAHDLLSITITNSAGTASADRAFPHSGYGLIGMRERAHAAGGRLRAGQRPRGGFEVVAELPLRPIPLEEPSAKQYTVP
ncbi:sensor histidine kinase [Streptomyces lincolnensis]|uniref:sensor histidine kinase n=1 Tax=Streptomyces TaxID=1883 RepID=UPI001E485D6B|nr:MULTISPECIES: sensor histidine kinase [Streptomyces]MCD7443210.1 sensor histidine kinase [Streptomyces lincolnensis]WLW50791.1 sensor histidine kinase [Streptomyces coralus]